MAGVAIIVLAAGEGRRVGADVPKAFLQVGGRRLFEHALERLGAVPGVVSRVLVVPADRAEGLEAPPGVTVVAGGATRRDSAAAGLRAVGDDVDVVLVHDAARPFATTEAAARVAEAARVHGAAILAAPVTDTIKRLVEAGDGPPVLENVPRGDLRAAQTPQGFRRDLYARALEASSPEDTDDAAMVERLGEPVVLVEGDPGNFKITVPTDLDRAGALLGTSAASVRMGMGGDLHRLEPGRPMRLGGVTVEADRGPLGHSDGDVILHALVDAILGAAALGDIGDHFPPSDDRWKDANSVMFLEEALRLAAGAGWTPVNASVVLWLDAPKLGPTKRRIADHLAALLGLSTDAVNLSAKTGEGAPLIGDGSHVMAQAVVAMGR